MRRTELPPLLRVERAGEHLYPLDVAAGLTPAAGAPGSQQ
jgi:hypothetical protein